jgi:hypothetical protein
MSITKRKQLVLSLEAELFTEFRKVIFREGLTPHEFVTFVAELVALRDPDVDNIINRLKKREKEIKKSQSVGAEELYRLIENKLASKDK